MTATDVPNPGELAEDNAIRDAAVRLLNEGGLALAQQSEICRVAKIDEEVFRRHYASVDQVFEAIVADLMTAHIKVADDLMFRRRSLTESLKIGLLAFWDGVENNIEIHQALKYLAFAGLAGSGPTRSAARPLHTEFLLATERRLLDLARVHQVTWELPVRQLARLMLAMLDGLVLDYLVSRDSTGARQMIEVFSYDMAQHGRRVAKNYPH